MVNKYVKVAVREGAHRLPHGRAGREREKVMQPPGPRGGRLWSRSSRLVASSPNFFPPGRAARFSACCTRRGRPSPLSRGSRTHSFPPPARCRVAGRLFLCVPVHPRRSLPTPLRRLAAADVSQPESKSGWRAGDMHGTTGLQWVAGGERAACIIGQTHFFLHTARPQARRGGRGRAAGARSGHTFIALTGRGGPGVAHPGCCPGTRV